VKHLHKKWPALNKRVKNITRC